MLSAVHGNNHKELTNQNREIIQQREIVTNQVSETKLQLKLTEESREKLRHDLLEANNKLREGKHCKSYVIWHLKFMPASAAKYNIYW